MIDIKEVLRRWSARQSLHQIAHETGVDRKTVRRYVRAAVSCSCTYSPDRTLAGSLKSLDWAGLDRSGGRCCLIAGALPGRGRHGQHVAKDDAACEAREHVRKVVLRVDTDEMAGREHRVRDRRALRTDVRAGEEKVATPEGRPAMETFDDPVVDRQTPILQKASQRDTVVEQIAERRAEQRAWGFHGLVG
jgi:predicted transcriptional regulator